MVKDRMKTIAASAIKWLKRSHENNSGKHHKMVKESTVQWLKYCTEHKKRGKHRKTGKSTTKKKKITTYMATSRKLSI